MLGAFLAHEVTALWDVSYAIDKRYVSPLAAASAPGSSGDVLVGKVQIGAIHNKTCAYFELLRPGHTVSAYAFPHVQRVAYH